MHIFLQLTSHKNVFNYNNIMQCFTYVDLYLSYVEYSVQKEREENTKVSYVLDNECNFYGYIFIILIYNNVIR